MTTQEKADIRLQNLKLLIDRYGGQRALARKMGKGPGLISHVMHGRRTISIKKAREWEEILMLHEGWFDVLHETPADAAMRHAKIIEEFSYADEPTKEDAAKHLNTLGAAADYVDLLLYSKAAETVCKHGAESGLHLSKEKVERVVSKVYDDAVSNDNIIDKREVEELLDIAKERIK